MKGDLDEVITVPSNFDALIDRVAERAAVQDSNYSSYAWSNIRYRGSRQSSKNFNVSF
jgi:hypothetical protein